MIEQDDPPAVTGDESLRDSLAMAFAQPVPDADGAEAPLETSTASPAERGERAAEPAQRPSLEPASRPSLEPASRPSPDAASRPGAPPQAWSAAAKARWAELPADLQQEIARREGDYTRGIEQKVLEARRHYAPLEQVIGPRREAWARQFGSPERGLQTLVEISEQAGRDPEGFVRWFAQNSGLDLGRLAHGAATTAPAEAKAEAPSTPHTDGDPRVALLSEQVNRLHAYLAGEQRARQAEQLSSLASVVDAFRADPEHEHFDAVAPDVLALIPVVRQAMPRASASELLEAAYERTIWGDPGIRERLIRQQSATHQASQQQDAAQARRSQAAALSLTGAPPAGVRPSPEFPSATLREELERQFASGRV